MKPSGMGTLFIFALGGALLAAPASARRNAASGNGQCDAGRTALIDAESHCVDSGGINIGDHPEDGMQVACMQDKRVQGVCGPDGQLTRLHAFQKWYNRLLEFQGECARSGGVFMYKDPNFTEPRDESFCLQAQPEVTSNIFEQQLCNFRSICPAVAVRCEIPCQQTASANQPPYL